MEEDYVAAAVDRSSDRRSAIIYRVAHSEGGCNFDEIPNGTAHGGTVVDKKESGPSFAHRVKKGYYGSPPKTIRKFVFFRLDAVPEIVSVTVGKSFRPEPYLGSSFPRNGSLSKERTITSIGNHKEQGTNPWFCVARRELFTSPNVRKGNGYHQGRRHLGIASTSIG